MRSEEVPISQLVEVPRGVLSNAVIDSTLTPAVLWPANLLVGVLATNLEITKDSSFGFDPPTGFSRPKDDHQTNPNWPFCSVQVSDLFASPGNLPLHLASLLGSSRPE